jgi:hypothetical protein
MFGFKISDARSFFYHGFFVNIIFLILCFSLFVVGIAVCYDGGYLYGGIIMLYSSLMGFQYFFYIKFISDKKEVVIFLIQ